MTPRTTHVMGIALFLVSLLAQAQGNPDKVSARAFAELDGHVGAQLSPDGEHLAFFHPIDGRLSLFVHDFASGDVFRIPPGDELEYAWLRWVDNDTIVLSMSYTATRQLTLTVETRLMSLDLTKKKITSIVKPAEIKGGANSRITKRALPPPQIQDDVIDWMPDDPAHVLVELDEDADGESEVRQINVSTGEYNVVREEARGVQDWLADASGDIRFGYGFIGSRFEARLKDTNGSWKLLTKADWYQDGWFPEAFTDDPSRIYVSGPGESGTRELRILNIDDGTFEETVFANAQFDLESLVFHPVTGRPAGISYIGHRREYQYFDEELDSLQKSLDKILANSTNKITSMSANSRRILIESSSDRDPGSLYILDRDLKSMEIYGRKNQFIEPDKMHSVAAVEYHSADGTTIPAYLTLPAVSDPRNLPAVVLPHGGPSARDDQSYWFLSQFLASRGYAVLQPNFRGSKGYGYAFERAGLKQWGGLMQDDVAAGAMWLIDQGIAGKDRICIAGWSYGGYAAAMGLAKTPTLYQCGISINGLYNLPQLIADDKDYAGGSNWVQHIGLDGESARSVSPFYQAESITKPLLIIYTKDDGRIPSSQAKAMYKQLKRTKSPAKLLALENGGHSLDDAASRIRALESFEQFLQETINPNLSRIVVVGRTAGASLASDQLIVRFSDPAGNQSARVAR